MYPFIFSWCWVHMVTQMNASALPLLCSRVKVIKAVCSLSAMRPVLFLMYKQLCLPGPFRNAAMSSSDGTQRATHLHKHRSVWFSTTHSMWQIQYDSFSVYTITGTGGMFRERVLERVPSAFVVAVRAARRGSSYPLADRVVSRTETLADENMVPSPQTMACLSCPQPWFRSCGRLLMSSQSCSQSQSELSAAAPVRTQPVYRHSVWQGTGLHGDTHTKAQPKFLVFSWNTCYSVIYGRDHLQTLIVKASPKTDLFVNRRNRQCQCT